MSGRIIYWRTSQSTIIRAGISFVVVSSCIDNCQQTCGQHGMYCSTAFCFYATYGERYTSKTCRVHQLTALLPLDGHLSRAYTPITVVQRIPRRDKTTLRVPVQVQICKYNQRCKIIQQTTYTIVGISTTVQHTDNLQFSSRHIMQHHVQQ